MKRTLTIIFTVLGLLLHSVLFAQEKITVNGVVKDTDGLPMAGVSVMVPGTQNGVNTGYEGEYSLTVNKGETIRFSFIGFETIDIVVNKKNYDVVMEMASAQLDQVVVTGYSQVEVRKTTGAVAVISSNELKDSPLKNIDQLLSGKLAGVNVKLTSGRPGASSRIRIRGTNTITGNAEPLWVIDGVPMQKNMPKLNNSQIRSGDFDSIFETGLGSINPNDIESVSVLKDAAAAAIYGSQGANGVIVVTTKRGEAGKIRLNYYGSLSLQTRPVRDANLMNAKEKLSWEQELWNEFSKSGYDASRSGKNAYYPVVGIVGQIRSGYGKFSGMSLQEQDAYIEKLGSESTDWFDVLFRNSLSTAHDLSASGGTETVKYYISGGYKKNNGIVVKTSAESYNMNAKLDINPTHFIKFGVQTDFSYMKSLAPSNNVDMFKYAYFANPYEKLYNKDGSYKADETYFTLKQANGGYVVSVPPQGFNIMREINETSSKADASSFSLKGDLNINIISGLSFRGLASFTYSNDLSENINGSDTYAAWLDRPFERNAFTSKRKYGSITQYTSLNTSYLLRGQFNYTKSLAVKHHLNVIAGSEIRRSYAKSLTSKRYGYDPVTGNNSTPVFTSDKDGKIDYGKLVSFGVTMDSNMGQSIIEDAFASFYSTATYNYDNRYVISGTLRSDGSNNFGSNSQFNSNWSLSGAWNIDEEKWFKKHLSSFVSTLGLRTGFGYTGGVNRKVFPVLIMDYHDGFRKTPEAFYRRGFISNAPNPNLSWEKNRTFNVGVNFGFLHDRITGEMAYYRNTNKEQVTLVRVTSTTGFRTQSFNTSEQVNNGFEFFISATPLKLKNFNWRISANVAYNYNKLTKYISPNGSLLGNIYVGYPLGKIFSGKSTGIDPETGLYDFELRPDISIYDTSDYKKYENYLFYVGTSNAPVNGGFSSSLTYKRLTFSIAGNFSMGAKIINKIEPQSQYTDIEKSKNEPIPSSKNDLYVNHLNVRKDVVRRWTPDNPITDGYPRIIDAYGPRLTDPQGNLLSLTRTYIETITKCTFLENLSYLKLSTISLSYSLPSKWAKAIRVSDINASLLLNNVYIFTRYSGLDPETPGAVYPQSRSYTFSLSISF